MSEPSTDRDSPSGRPYSARYVRYVVFLLFLVNIINYMDRTALAVLAPLVKADLQLSDSKLGLLIGLAFALFYAICGIPIARWADRGIRRNIISLGMVVWSVFTALCGAAHNFWHLLLARIGVGAGEAGSWSPGSSILCDYVPVRRRPGIFAIFAFGQYGGTMVGMALAGWLGASIGWRWTFVALGVPGIVVALIVRFTLREPVRGRFDVLKGGPPGSSIRETVRILWRCRTYRSLLLFLVANGFVQSGLIQWWPSLYARVLGLHVSAVGSKLGIALGVGSGVGLLLGGLLANRYAQRDVRLPLMIGAGATCLALPAAIGALFVPSVSGSMMLVWLTVLFWAISNGPVLATQYSVVRSNMRATAGAIGVFLTAVLGIGLGPFCVGLLSDALRSTHGVEALRYAMLAPVCLIPVMVIALYAAARALPQDLPTVVAQLDDGFTPGASGRDSQGVPGRTA